VLTGLIAATVFDGDEGGDEFNEVRTSGMNVTLNENPIRRDLGIPKRTHYHGNEL
jgi:hypothetical protein